MKEYFCINCNKKFKQKSDYDRHNNRQKLCEPNKDIITLNNTIQELMKQLEEKDQTIKEIMKETEDIIKDKQQIIKDQDFIIKTYTSSKKDNIESLLTHKDKLSNQNIEIFLNTFKNYDNMQDLHQYIINIFQSKNNKDNFLLSNLYKRYKNEYIYLIRTRECVKLNEQIYKIGKTKKEDIKERFDHYPKGIEIIAFFSVKDSDKVETALLEIFNKTFKIKFEYGNEYFEGNIKDMLEQLINIILLEY